MVQIQEQHEEPARGRQSEDRCHRRLRWRQSPHPALTTAVVSATLSPQTGEGVVCSLAVGISMASEHKPLLVVPIVRCVLLSERTARLSRGYDRRWCVEARDAPYDLGSPLLGKEWVRL